MTHRDFAPINGALLYFEDSGGAGEPLVFVHAGVADLRLWDAQAAYFAPRYRVLRYDQCGFGQSQPTAREFSHTEDLVGLLDYWGVNKVHLVGCSMGGGTCFEVALDYPEWVASLTLVCSAPHGLELDAPEDAGLQALFRAVETAWQAGDVEQTAELEMRIWYDGVGRTPAETESPARRLALAMNRQALLYEQQGIGKRKAKTPPYAGQRLTELQVPLCMIVGQLDEPYSLVAADYLAAHIAGAQKFIIPHTAHLPSLERPAEFNALLAQFLGQPA